MTAFATQGLMSPRQGETGEIMVICRGAPRAHRMTNFTGSAKIGCDMIGILGLSVVISMAFTTSRSNPLVVPGDGGPTKFTMAAITVLGIIPHLMVPATCLGVIVTTVAGQGKIRESQLGSVTGYASHTTMSTP